MNVHSCTLVLSPLIHLIWGIFPNCGISKYGRCSSTFCDEIGKQLKNKKKEKRKKSCSYDFATPLKEKQSLESVLNLCVHVPLPYTSIPE